jgi:acetate kinase
VRILCINAGSSSLKVAVRIAHSKTPLVSGAVESIGRDHARLWLRGADGAVALDERHAVDDHARATALALDGLQRIGGPAPDAVGHRIVHGGRRFAHATRIDGNVLAELRTLVGLAPLHLPPQIDAIEAVAVRMPRLPQVACFDTAFHRRMPEIAQRFPLPEWAWEDGICRYGFHGLSFEHVVGVLGDGCGSVVIAHLGNGASLAAVRDGAPLDTTMAFTPAAGIMMGTRPGDLDPGVLVHLARHRGMGPAEIDRLINLESGLVGVSGTTSDMRSLVEARATDPRAALAVDMFCRSARKAIGALATVLGGLDQLVFTGGIGERAGVIRDEICRGLEHLGISLDSDANATDAATVSGDGSPCIVRVIPAGEDVVIARQTAAAVREAGRPLPGAHT